MLYKKAVALCVCLNSWLRKVKLRLVPEILRSPTVVSVSECFKRTVYFLV